MKRHELGDIPETEQERADLIDMRMRYFGNAYVVYTAAGETVILDNSRVLIMRTKPPICRDGQRRIYWERGFFRVNLFGFRFAVINTRKHFALFSDRTAGLHIGRWIFRLHRCSRGG